MNDLAEKALHGLDVAHRAVRARPMLSFGVVGFLVGCAVVVSGGVVGSAQPDRPLTSWFGIQAGHATHLRDPLPAALFVAALVALVVCWVAVVEFVRRTPQPALRVWWLAAAWGAPFAVGPPLLDTTIYRYVAFGLLQRDGFDPYAVGPSRLGDVPVVAAIDPGARGLPSSAGPLGTVGQHLAVSMTAGNALAALIVLRVAGVLAAVVIGRLAADLAGARPARALTLTVLNPLLLLYVVSAAHLDGVLIAFVLAALLQVRHRHWTRAIVLGCLAGSVSGPGFVIVPMLAAAHWFGRTGRLPRWRRLVRDGTAAAVTILAVGFAVPDGFGWLGTVRQQFATHTPFSVVGAVGALIGAVVRAASYDDLAAGARITALAALGCVLGYLVWTARQRAVPRTVGYALIATGLLAPVLYPWYLLWGTLCLAPFATGPRRLAVLGLCAASCLLVPPGFGDTASYAITGGWLLAVAVAVAVAHRHRRLPRDTRARPAPEPASLTGTLSAGS